MCNFAELISKNIGSLLEPIANIVVLIAIAVTQYRQANRFKKIESKNIEKERKITLFDKRYEIYDLFTRLYNRCCEFLNIIEKEQRNGNCELSDEDIKDFLKEVICSDFSNLDGIFARNTFLENSRQNEEEGKDGYRKEQRLKRKYQILYSKFLHDSFSKLNMTKFCFENKQVAEALTNFSKILLIGIEKESDSRDFEERESDNHFLADKFFSDLRKCMDKIEAEQIIQKMENEIEFNIV